ncbi:SpoIIE family protein phosphatase [Streptomyces lunaelactis]|uniref:SpoIIE family protein phosphatase n=1 Tax=Streptomyces lunaelactis TaxID=1535768 RepID=UPI0015846C1B|nr:SpoIIE family protein phosphatase [Streptomyces lunaelactis]NUK00104.1 SpoIIE family protein phosphatase [Streptomyces lunaelactis]NUK15440.1 SpoIIE family protein phosphatase [Streptomyces lunaelactis]NUK33166.1 SpoIIE family protein phosphatase [Streptomyces lunaelactis]NUK40731.1 SpoIIE family protein phosphatase [Streptomyces lunaelactis]NUK49556.1 SpoIIE family protein phosphatase [Streptomyces lunaelactis]
MSAVTAAEDADLRGPLDVTRAATAVLDGDGTVVGWSPTAQELLGYPAQEVLGSPIGAFVVDRGGERQAAADLPAAAHFRRWVLHMRHRDGRVVRVATAMLSLSHAGGEPARLLAMAAAEETEQWEALQAMLRGLATQSPVGLAIYDTDLRVVWTNFALFQEMGTAQYVGMGPDDMVTNGEILSPSFPETLEETMRQVLVTGEPVIELHYRGRPPVDPERDHVWSCSYYRLQDVGGATLGVCEETVDITDRYLAQQRLDLLVRAGRCVGTTLDMTRTAQELCEVSVPHFADAVTVDLLEAVLEGDQPTPGTVTARRLVRVWGGPDGEAPAQGEARTDGRERIDYLPDSPQARSLSSGRAVQERPAGGDGVQLPPHPRLVVPLRAEGATLGVVTFAWERHPDPFDAGELAVADELVARAAVCLDNARRFTREHTAALMLQRSLLPQNLPRQSAVELAYRYLPADSGAGVGGDWFDVITLSGTRVGLVVGDVVGHGLRAAATMGRVRTSVRVLARLDLAPDELLARLDDLIEQPGEQPAGERAANEQPAGERTVVRAGGDEVPDDEAVGVTCLYAVYDPVSGLCCMARAGHPLPAVVDPATGSVSFPDLPAGPPLGLGGLPFESAELKLPEGSLIALFTDGLVQGRDRDPDTGLSGLSDVLAGHRRPLDELSDQAVARLLPGPVEDDAALLLVRTRMLDGHQVAEWELAADPEEVGRARTEAAELVGEWGLDELVFTTELVVSELVTNAIRYASGPIHLRLIRDETLICEVSDTGHTSPHLRRAAGDDEGGRGLFLVAQLTQQWGTRYTPSGKTIWAEQALPPPAA